MPAKLFIFHSSVIPMRLSKNIPRHVQYPDRETRAACAEIHLRKIRAPSVNKMGYRKIADATGGWTCAEIAQVVNDAALNAARARAKEVGGRGNMLWEGFAAREDAKAELLCWRELYILETPDPLMEKLLDQDFCLNRIPHSGVFFVTWRVRVFVGLVGRRRGGSVMIPRRRRRRHCRRCFAAAST